MKNPSAQELAALRQRALWLSESLGPLHTDGSGSFTPDSRQRLDDCMRAILKRNRAVGASIVLCHPGGAADIFHYGYARLAPKIPVTEKTCFRVASVSKLVMSFAALSLMEDGLLSLDCDISNILGYAVRNPHAPDVPVTLRMLLTHTAAITDDGPYGTRGMQPGCTLRELLSDPASWTAAAPGTSFLYSNLGAGAAGVVLERAAGMPFDDILNARVFAPLSIRASYDPRRISPVDDLADGYSVRGILPPRRRYDAAALAARPPEAFDPERDYLIAAGRMITDSHGLSQLVRLLGSKDGMGVLVPASLAEIRTPQDGKPGISFAGRGLNVAFLPDLLPGVSLVGHQGVAYGMCAELFADPATGAGVGIMTSGVRLVRQPPLMRAGFDLLTSGFAALSKAD